MIKKLSKKLINSTRRSKQSIDEEKPVEVEEEIISKENNSPKKGLFKDRKKLLKMSVISLVSGLILGYTANLSTDREAEEAIIDNFRENIIIIEDEIETTKKDLEKYEEYKNILESVKKKKKN